MLPLRCKSCQSQHDKKLKQASIETMAPETQATVSKNLQEIKVKPKKLKKQPPRILKRGPKPKLSDQEVLSSQNERRLLNQAPNKAPLPTLQQESLPTILSSVPPAACFTSVASEEKRYIRLSK